MTQRVVGILGTGVVGRDAAVVASDDLGLTRGDGCFEATRIVTDAAFGHTVDHLDAHLHRLETSAAGLDLAPPDLDAWRALIGSLLDAWRIPGESMLKLMLTRGRESAPEGPVTGVATITEISPIVVAQRSGIAVVTLDRGVRSDAYAVAPWLLGGVKTLSYAVNVAAAREARRRGADDVLFTSSDGLVLEGPTSAAVWVEGDRMSTTPTGATGILDSITQKALFTAAAKNGWHTEYALATPERLHAADGLWLVSSGRGAAPVTSLDGRPLARDERLDAEIKGLAGFAV